MMIRQFPSVRRRALAALEPREALRAAIEKRGVELARLSRVIRRHPSYIGRYLRDGVPAALEADDHELLAAYLGAGPDELGDREYWTRRPAA